MQFALDAAGNRTRLTFPSAAGGLVVSDTYDSLNRLTGVYQGAASAASRVVGYGYDILGRRSTASYAAAAPVASTAIGYNAADLESSITHSWNGASFTPTRLGDDTTNPASCGVIGCIVHSENGLRSPNIDPKHIAGKTPQEIGKIAIDSGLIPKGPDPENGFGSYDDPVTGKQRILSHPNDKCFPHCHVNNPLGERLDINGNMVKSKSPEAHLPIGGI